MTNQTIEITEMEAEMAKKYARLPVLTCKRCGHKWVPRIPSPAVCPGCPEADVQVSGEQLHKE